MVGNGKLPTPVRETISAEQLDTILRGHPGLLIGPGMTLGAGSLSELSLDLTTTFALGQVDKLFATADSLLLAGIPESEIRQRVRDKLTQTKANPAIDLIVKNKWSAVLSASIDPYFEQLFQVWCDKSPTRRPVTAVTAFRQPIPPNSIPVYKLLGSAYRDDFVLSSNDYRVQLPQWPRVLRDFATFVRGAPTLCTGFAEFPWVLLDLLALMLSDPQMAPGPIIVLEDDPISRNGQLDDLARRGLRIVNVKMSVAGFIAAIKSSAKSGHTQSLDFESNSTPPLQQLRSFSDLAVPVNAHLAKEINASEVNRLRDLLFSPTVPSWEPFLHGLDFPRTITTEIFRRCKIALASKTRPYSEIMVNGASATGKTTVLKRVALELASEGFLTMWMRPYFYQNGPAELRRMFELIAETHVHGDRRLVIVADDPLVFGTVRVEDVVSALKATGLEALILLGSRITDLAMSDTDLQSTIDPDAEEIEIPDRFDEIEWKTLPEYLLRLGIAQTLEAAKASTSNAPGRSTRDVLGMLFWLLPQTRQKITESVRDEYLRLGDRASFSQVIVGEFNHTSDLVKDAYGLVSVAAKYGTPVPMEVIVSALGVRYDEWLDTTRENGLLWGLLYQEASEDGSTTVYRMRNDVVTDIVVGIVNGGSLSRAGELSRLGRLLGACNGTSPIYREFALRILVPPSNTRSHLEKLEYIEGLELFERALNALPYEDRTLLHHLGRWEKNKGGDPSRARLTLQRALKTTAYPYASRGEPTEHIHTTLAANELDAIKLGQISIDEGKAFVLAHLERARAGNFFANANAVHVQARHIATLVDLTGNPSDPDTISLIDTALADIDRMVLLLRSEYVSDDDRRHQIETLEQARGEVLDRCVPSDHQLNEDAERLWTTFRRQDGFVLVARKLFGAASRSNKGSDFLAAFEYCTGIRSRVQDAHEQLSYTLAEVMLHTYFRWRVRRAAMSASSSIIDWNLIEWLSAYVIGAARSRTDPFYSYLRALARAHLGDWTGANAIFETLRSRGMPPDVLYEPRDYLMEDAGGMRRVQGVVHLGTAGKKFVHVESLDTDLILDRNGKWGREGETVHPYVRFRFAGPVAAEEP